MIIQVCNLLHSGYDFSKMFYWMHRDSASFFCSIFEIVERINLGITIFLGIQGENSLWN